MPEFPPPAPPGHKLGTLHRFSPYAEYLFLFTFTCVLLWPLCLGRALYWGDIQFYFAPMLRFQQEALQHGRIPLWNPTVLGGQPLLGNPQMGVFYPTTPLLLNMPVWLYLSVTTILHVFLSGACMYAYLRHWSRNIWSCLAGSLTYMGGECLIGRIQFPPMIFSAPYFPLLLLTIDCCFNSEMPTSYSPAMLSGNNGSDSDEGLRLKADLARLRRQLKTRLQLSLVIGLLVLAAHPQMAYLILLAGSIYAASRLAAQLPIFKPGVGQARSPFNACVYQRSIMFAGSLMVAGILGLLLASVQVLPAIQVLLESPREKLTPAQANRFYLEPAHLLRLILPRFWGHPASADFWGGGNAWEPAFFVGWLPVLLISFACIRFRKRRKVQFWIATALVGIWLSIGNVGGLYWLAFKSIPGLSNFHDPARFLLFTSFAFAVLTTLGWHACWKSFRYYIAHRQVFSHKRGINPPWREQLWQFAGLLAVTLPLLWNGWDWNPTVPHEFYAMRSRWPGPPVDKTHEKNINGRGERLYLPAHELYWKHYVTDGYSDYGPNDAQHIQALLDTWMPNLNTAWQVDSASGYEPVPLSAPSSVDALGRIALRREEPNLSRLLSVMGVSTLLLPRVYDGTAPALSPSTTDAGTSREFPVRAFKNRDALPIAWIAPYVHVVEGTTRLTASLTAPDFKPGRVAILHEVPKAYADEMDQISLLAFGTVPEPAKRTEENNSFQRSQEKRLDQETFAQPRIRSQENHLLEMCVDNGTLSGFLVVNRTAFPGWKADIDGKATAIYRADGALMGVFLPPGSHTIVIRYSPQCYQFGGYLTLLSVSVLAGTTGYLLCCKATTRLALRQQA